MTAEIGAVCQVIRMTDTVLARARLAVDEAAALRERRRLLRAESERNRELLQLAVAESAMLRVEIKAHRDDRWGQSLQPKTHTRSLAGEVGPRTSPA